MHQVIWCSLIWWGNLGYYPSLLVLNRVGERLHNWPWAPQLVSGRARILHKQPDSLVQLSRVPISAVSLMITGSSEAKEFCHLKSVFEFSMVPSWLLQLPLSLSLCHLCTQIRSHRLLLSVDVSSCVAHLFRGSWHAHKAAFKICRNLQQALSVALKKKRLQHSELDHKTYRKDCNL